MGPSESDLVASQLVAEQARGFFCLHALHNIEWASAEQLEEKPTKATLQAKATPHAWHGTHGMALFMALQLQSDRYFPGDHLAMHTFI